MAYTALYLQYLAQWGHSVNMHRTDEPMNQGISNFTGQLFNIYQDRTVIFTRK